MGIFDKLKKNEIKNETNNELPPISENDMGRIHTIMEDIKQHDYDFYNSLQNLSLYAFPLESNTKLLPVTDVAHKMISELHYCFKAKSILNILDNSFVSSEAYKKFMISFTDGFIFNELEEIDNCSDKNLIEELSRSNYLAYFYAYILGLIDKMPNNPKDCDEIQLCNLVTKFNSYAELLNNCKMLNKQSILYIADSLVLVSEYNIYKEEHNIPFDKEIRNYKTIQRFCAFYVLSYDVEAMISKLKELKEQ